MVTSPDRPLVPRRPGPPSPSPRSFAASVISRVLAAALGGYALTYAATAALSVFLPAARAEAVLIASMLSFALYTAAILWSFAVRDASRAWLGLLGPALILTAIALLTMLADAS